MMVSILTCLLYTSYIIELDFESSCNEMESECPSYSFKLIGKQEHCYIEKKFKVKSVSYTHLDVYKRQPFMI